MKDKLSALLDGALEEPSVHSALDAMRRDQALRAQWDTYCLIGDVIRGEPVTEPDFLSRVMAGIEAEPIRIAPASAAAAAARRGVWGAAMPLAASVMGVAAVGLVAHALFSGGGEARTEVAVSAPAVEAVAAQAPLGGAAVAAGDSQREYVFAHQAMTAGGPMPDAIQYVRTVSEVRPDSGR